MASFQLPLFPLHTVLFPGGVLPLRIFEVRYLDLISRCQREGAPFGVVCLTQGREVRQPPQGNGSGAAANDFEPEDFHLVGTMAHIAALERPQPGLMLIRCTGGRRFRLLGREQLRHGLWVGEAEYLEDDPPVPVPPDLVHVRMGLERLVQHMRARAEGGAGTLPLQEPLQWNDCGWVANRWCELLPLGLQLRQLLMVVEGPLVRLELVADLLARWKISEPPAAQ